MSDTPAPDPAEGKPVGAALGGGGAMPAGHYVQGGRWLQGGSPHAPGATPPKPPGSGDLTAPAAAPGAQELSSLLGGGGGQG